MDDSCFLPNGMIWTLAKGPPNPTTLAEKLPIRSVAGRVADRPNKHSSCLEPKELFFLFYYICGIL
jgi:hypothetical protein